jgi:alkylation response protein AidB-like acyl-CoA dehydrogenase
VRWKIEDTPEQRVFREEFRGWLRSRLPDGWMEGIDSGDDAAYEKAHGKWNMYDWHKAMGEAGYSAPLWPKEYGGLGGEVWMQNTIREELVQYRLPIISVNILGLGLAAPTIIAHGSEEQKRRYLPKILTSEEIWCQLFSEPGSGSDLAGLSTRAVRDGDAWVVNGQKVWTSIAQFAHFGLLLARTNPDVPKHDGLTYFILDMKSPGIEIRPLRQMTGSSEFNEVFFTDVRVPDANRVGAEGEGWLAARTTLMNERVVLGGIAVGPEAIVGGARRDPWRAFLEAIPDRTDKALRQQIARLYIENEVKEITAFRAALARRRGQEPGPEGGVGKVYNAELNQRRTAFAMNAAGPASIAWVPGDDWAERRAMAFLRARANTIEGGTSEVLRNSTGERLLGLPREPEVDRGVPWKEIRRS